MLGLGKYNALAWVLCNTLAETLKVLLAPWNFHKCFTFHFRG